MPSIDHPVVVVGAGPSGLAMARHLKEQAIPFLVLEQDSGVGGLWRYGSPQSAVYASAHLISSKRGTEYPEPPTCSMTVPMGTVRALPIGIDFMSGAGRDADVFAAGYAFEQASRRLTAPAYHEDDMTVLSLRDDPW